jgi:hypothetical protein
MKVFRFLNSQDFMFSKYFCFEVLSLQGCEDSRNQVFKVSRNKNKGFSFSSYLGFEVSRIF